MRKLDPKFTFAGFTFPRYIVELKPEKGRLHVRCVYYTAPTPGECTGKSFYLDAMGSPSRWAWCDDVCRHIDHTGWFCDDFQFDKIRGLVVRLPHGRYLAGWSMGEQMASWVDSTEVYTDETEAARAADSLAEYAAEREREYQEEEERKRQEEEDNQGSDEEETEGY